MVKDSDILDRLLEPLRQNISEELARGILSLEFARGDQDRYQHLSVKANRGTLTADEENELDRFLAVNDFLSIMKAEAQVLLKRKNSTA